MAIQSREKEEIKLINPVDVNEGEKRGNIERWLSELESSMRETIRFLCNSTIRDTNGHGNGKRTNWILSWPAQCILAVNLIKWTRDTEDAIRGLPNSAGRKMNLKTYFKYLNDQLVETVEFVRKDLTDVERITLGSLVVIDVHVKDIVHNLMIEECKNITDFNWISQLRQYWHEDEATK